MKRMRKQNKIFLFVILLLALSIGFAYVNGTLKINGIANVIKQTWDVHFENIQVKTGSVTPVTPATIDSEDTTKITYNIKLDNPGDFYEFNVDVVNAGTIDAMIGEIISTNNNQPLNLPEYVRYSVTYDDGIEIENNHLLPANSSQKYKVRVEFRSDIDNEDLENIQELDLRLKLEIKYTQATDDAIIRPLWISIGDYIRLVPDASSYTVLSSDSGYTSDQTITPNELTLWRVIGINKDGSIDAISDQVSSNTVYVYGAQGYANYVNLMQTIAQQYQKTGYTKSARMFGYDGQTLTIPAPTGTCDDDFCKNNTTYPFDDSTVDGFCPGPSGRLPTPTEGTGYELHNGVFGDTLYLKDYLLVKDAYSDYTDMYSDTTGGVDFIFLLAPIVNTEIIREEYYYEKYGHNVVYYYGADYYVASRLYDNNFGCEWEIRYVNDYQSILVSRQHRHYYNGWINEETNHHLRPIITLNSNVVKASGDGSKNNPYTFQ